MNTKIVVNADDFGMNFLTTSAILKSFEMGWISTTTIMPTMPGFEEACEFAHEYNLLDKIGIHFNLTEGQPLTEKIKRCPKFYNQNGEMYKSGKGLFLSAEEKEAIRLELEAQFKRLKEMDIYPTHADSHHHVHNYWNIGMILADFAKSNNIPAVRLSFNYGKNFSWKRITYSKLFNDRLKLKTLAKTKYFCEIRQITPELLRQNKPVEVMVHPIYDDKGNMTNYVGGDNFETLITKYLNNQRFVTYKDLAG